MHFCNFPRFNQSTPESSLDRPLLSGLFSQTSQNWCKVAGLSKLSPVVNFVDYKFLNLQPTPLMKFSYDLKKTFMRKIKVMAIIIYVLMMMHVCIIIVQNCLSFELQPVVGPGWVQWQSFLKINIAIYTFINLYSYIYVYIYLYCWPFEKHLQSIIPFLPFLLPAIFLFSYFIWSSTAVLW